MTVTVKVEGRESSTPDLVLAMAESGYGIGSTTAPVPIAKFSMPTSMPTVSMMPQGASVELISI